MEQTQKVEGENNLVAGSNVVRVNGHVTGQVAGGNISNIVNMPEGQHIDPSFSRDCPHCGSINKQFATNCRVCDFPMLAWDAEQDRKRKVRKAGWLVAVGMLFMPVAIFSRSPVVTWSAYFAVLSCALLAQRTLLK